MNIGLDVGSTTIKCVVLDENFNIIYRDYKRHFSKIKEKICEILNYLKVNVIKQKNIKIAISGSAAMGIAQDCGFDFIQEVYATRAWCKQQIPQTDVIIELGGEDAKILFLKNGSEARMNGSCAGGTGAFIDQMATLLNSSVEEMNKLAKESQKIYTIASRCGVFAKSDIQPLLNQGALKSDIAASIFMAVVNQTIAGLAQGRKIQGNVVYLGGPLSFFSELRACFDKTLGLNGNLPENALYFVALGAAICAKKKVDLENAILNVKNYKTVGKFATHKPLFENEMQYQDFKNRHSKAKVQTENFIKYNGPIYLGIDAGSTTLKAVLIGEQNQILFSKYMPNKGNPVLLFKEFLKEIYQLKPEIEIKSGTATGYGEELIQNAFCLDFGIVETMAHMMAAKQFMPDVEFIIDIGGQDIKCFKIKNANIDNIFLNEACSSGCGSFLQTFANALGYEIEDFAKLGLLAKTPVDLGSRCTVFMNSSVKQAQKDGATIEDISAGLSLSVVKNALYKVIRVNSPEELGKKIVVQGGTFLNDAVLRAFEQELNINVIRPEISGLMGAYGAALYGKEMAKEKSTVLKLEEILDLTHKIQAISCRGCNNNCKLTVNTFDGKRKFIAGNRCEKPITNKNTDNSLNIYHYKLEKLREYKNFSTAKPTIGLPLVLNMFELLPFWYTFFKSLGFGVSVSPFSNREIYLEGQHTIPSDTVCFPAKLVHGHIESLCKMNVDYIFYPCMSYNLDENLGDNHYNCPVVAYYPEVISANCLLPNSITLIKEYVGLHRPKDFVVKSKKILEKYFGKINLEEIKIAAELAFKEYYNYLDNIRKKGEEIIHLARIKNKSIIVLAGRPYHVDPEINHGIDKLVSSMGAAVISEDIISNRLQKVPTTVLNQWTYHSRLYSAARYIGTTEDMNLVQLVSFGCGVDAITTDEVRDILEQNNKIYTQLKIDEITNLGAIKIRLRSLFAANAKNI